MNDAGLLVELRSRYSRLGLTASISCAVMNEADVAFYQEIDVCRIVADTRLALREFLLI